jgi:mRNA interferase RelE/StbE
MSAFKVILTPEAQVDLRRLDSAIQTRILGRLEWIGDNADVLRHQALKGDEWRGCFKYRVGDYRIIYQLEQTANRLIILKVGHRRQVYG